MSSHGKITAGPGEGAGKTHRQVAALCWRMHGGAPEVLLITSRDTGRWVVPKGWPMAGKTAAETAAREAWEEAGVTGEIAAQSLGDFHYPKLFADADAKLCQVEVFPLRVRGLAQHYPERRQRRRKWFGLQKAARKVDEPELRALLLGFAADVAAGAAESAGAEAKAEDAS